MLKCFEIEEIRRLVPLQYFSAIEKGRQIEWFRLSVFPEHTENLRTKNSKKKTQKKSFVQISQTTSDSFLLIVTRCLKFYMLGDEYDTYF